MISICSVVASLAVAISLRYRRCIFLKSNDLYLLGGGLPGGGELTPLSPLQFCSLNLALASLPAATSEQ